MEITKYYLILLSFFFLLIAPCCLAQEVRVELGPSEVALNETFFIKVTISNEKVKSYDQFPEIPGFQKQGISQSSSMNLINGQMSSSNSIMQYYKPIRKGQYTLGTFTIKINGEDHTSAGKNITITDPASGQSRSRSQDPFDDFFGRGEAPEYIELEDEAFFSMSLDKNEVYVGEGFNVSLAFFMSETNQAPFNFHEPGKQLESILKKIKPSNVWEENFNIFNIQPEAVEINGKRWTKFKVYEATFYPFSEGEIELPQIGWEMIKYRVAKNPSFFGSNRQEDFKTFYSSSKTVKVKPLPPHPLKNEVSVGDYRLRENFTQKEVGTGEGFTYNFGITGEGNINAIGKPRLIQGQKLNTYDPNVRQEINRGMGKVRGIKEFNYFMTINEPGEHQLAKNLEFIFFNPTQERYDTLRPMAVVLAEGESKLNQSISSTRLGGIYDLIEVEDNKLLNPRYKYYFSAFINLLLLGSVILLVILLVKRK
ncbi:BatD family protein [Pararhodonellum marinum]|uniref:BatD family protein n=1 Tax=Pararhodonellum marinum TaxID=2755358 RepID=UPI00188FF9E2|nr:BatD family protein [Pararhodonellum marinum]